MEQVPFPALRNFDCHGNSLPVCLSQYYFALFFSIGHTSLLLNLLGGGDTANLKKVVIVDSRY